MPFRDQLGRVIHLDDSPQRIISLVPSITELLHYLGLGDQVIGVTRFCTHPASWRKEKKRVGGTKDPDLDLIRTLRPDLILANKEENIKAHIDDLGQDFPVWVSDVSTLDEALEMITSIGKLVSRETQADTLCASIKAGFEELSPPTHSPRTAYFIWKEPWMVSGSENFISFVLERGGFVNLYAGDKQRYPTIKMEELRMRSPEVLMLSSEPYPFGIKNEREMKTLFPEAQVIRVDGRMFSWYGSALLETPHHLMEIFSRLK